jgi:DNA-binding response OmpR family regulator
MARILIIEDEDKLRHALRPGLEEVGYDVIVVEGGESGLARAAGEPFDCLDYCWRWRALMRVGVPRARSRSAWACVACHTASRRALSS